ncbi:MAG: 4-(cytidine 5'-diphospho)-2-C-methyl-D-erythritol kinase, partial [Methyloligellaceae bacterium]
AAALRAIVRANNSQSFSFDWPRMAKCLGADVAVCYGQRAAVMTGIGEAVTPAPRLPEIAVVIVNPAIPLPTQTIYAALNAPDFAPHLVGGTTDLDRSFGDLNQLMAYLETAPNDLEQAALSLVPAVGDVKAELAAQDGCLLARLSGSGSTCFGIFPDQCIAETAEHAIARQRPDWWVRSSLLR